MCKTDLQTECENYLNIERLPFRLVSRHSPEPFHKCPHCSGCPTLFCLPQRPCPTSRTLPQPLKLGQSCLVTVLWRAFCTQTPAASWQGVWCGNGQKNNLAKTTGADPYANSHSKTRWHMASLPGFSCPGNGWHRAIGGAILLVLSSQKTCTSSSLEYPV